MGNTGTAYNLKGSKMKFPVAYSKLALAIGLSALVSAMPLPAVAAPAAKQTISAVSAVSYHTVDIDGVKVNW